MHNFTYILENFMSWSMQGYTTAIGYFVWPIIFAGIIGYVYIKNTSAISASVAIIIVFTCFGGINWIAGVPGLVMIFQLIVALSITGMILYFVTRRRG